MILITGGAGYIATHTLIELKKANFDFIVYDNLSNSSKDALKRVKKIIGSKVKFIKGDIRDKKALRKVFKKYCIYSVIHFAGLKAVGESVIKPLKYYDNNPAKESMIKTIFFILISPYTLFFLFLKQKLLKL
jgi:UDP-glucose 4-epimerase